MRLQPGWEPCRQGPARLACASHAHAPAAAYGASPARCALLSHLPSMLCSGCSRSREGEPLTEEERPTAVGGSSRGTLRRLPAVSARLHGAAPAGPLMRPGGLLKDSQHLRPAAHTGSAVHHAPIKQKLRLTALLAGQLRGHAPGGLPRKLAILGLHKRGPLGLAGLPPKRLLRPPHAVLLTGGGRASGRGRGGRTSAQPGQAAAASPGWHHARGGRAAAAMHPAARTPSSPPVQHPNRPCRTARSSPRSLPLPHRHALAVGLAPLGLLCRRRSRLLSCLTAQRAPLHALARGAVNHALTLAGHHHVHHCGVGREGRGGHGAAGVSSRDGQKEGKGSAHGAVGGRRQHAAQQAS